MAEPTAKVAKVEKTVVMMNGLPGAMGNEVGRACLRAGFELSTEALTGSGCAGEVELKEGDITAKVKLVAPGDGKGAHAKVLADAVQKYGDRLVVIDFTHPSAVDGNAKAYQEAKANFVMGTTGGDRDLLMSGTRSSGVYAVIAPNMAKQIVALQATLEKMGADFPGAFAGYSLEITESHQKTKADTSGTAKAMVTSFQKMGVPFKVDEIKQLRTEEESKAFGVPAEYLDGHAFHTYALKSSDGTVTFQFQHNVNGRLCYAEGVVDTVLFLRKQAVAKGEQRVFSMIDVLSAGAMR